jgi:hypothetical protein
MNTIKTARVVSTLGKLIIIALLALAYAVSLSNAALGQEPPKLETRQPLVFSVRSTKPQNDSLWNLNAKLSAFAFAGTMTADCLSTNGLHENNRLLRNSHGGVNMGVCFGLNSGVLGLTIALQKKYPRAMTWLRWIGAAGHGAAYAHNQAVKQ